MVKSPGDSSSASDGSVSPDSIAWPDPPAISADDPQADGKKARYTAQLQWALAEKQALAQASAGSRQSARSAYIYAVEQALTNAYINLATKAIDNAQARGQFVQTAASAIAAIYSGILALSFSVGKDVAAGVGKLPVEGLVPDFFMGLAIVLAAIFLGYIEQQRDLPGPRGSGNDLEALVEERNAFLRYAGEYIRPRLYFLHAAVVSLGAGIISLPSAYLAGAAQPLVGTLSASATIWIAALVALVLVFSLPKLIEHLHTPNTSSRLPNRVD